MLFRSENAALLRLSASNPGNDHRLGANEAPPAIISIFLGEQLEDVVKQLVDTGEATSSKQGGKLNVGVHTIPELVKDATDRNRTSPFAFTGNKFEFRMVASSMSIAGANTVLNTIVADVLSKMADELEKAEDFDQAVHDLIKKTFTEHQRVIFNGNGYSDAWVEEAERRGLPNLKSMVDAIPSLVSDKTIEMFGRLGVLTETELHSRVEINYELYSKAINIEAKTMIEMAAKKYTIFTNVAYNLDDDTIWWEKFDKNPPENALDWQGNPWNGKTSKEKGAHPNSRFTSPAKNCPCISKEWEAPEGVPISAIIFEIGRAHV